MTPETKEHWNQIYSAKDRRMQLVQFPPDCIRWVLSSFSTLTRRATVSVAPKQKRRPGIAVHNVVLDLPDEWLAVSALTAWNVDNLEVARDSSVDPLTRSSPGGKSNGR